MSKRKRSGADFRKLKKLREEERKQLAGSWSKWLNKEQTKDPGCSSSRNFTERKENSASEHESDVDEQEMVSHEEESGSTQMLPDDSASANMIGVITTKTEKELLISTDPAAWQRPYSHSFIVGLVEKGPEQGVDVDFMKSSDNEGRRFSEKWLYKSMSNGETVRRDWLIFSKSQASVFCFPCLLFGKYSNPPKLCDPGKGFSNWKKLNPKIGDHENSQEHRNTYIRWKELEKRLKSGQVIESELEKDIQFEKNKWKHILKAIINAVLFCVENNLALRGSSNDINTKDCGIFLNTIKLIAKHDPEIRCHIEAVSAPGRHISYFSNHI